MRKAEEASEMIQVRIGPSILDATHVDAVLKAVAAATGRDRIDHLADALNPRLLDPAKVATFLRGLNDLPLPTRSQLEGQVVYLQYPALMLGVVDPVRAEAIAAGFDLDIDTPGPPLIMARLVLQPDCLLADQRRRDAAAAVRSADAIITDLDAAIPAELDLRHENRSERGAWARARFAAAITWRANAQAYATCHPEDPDAEDEAKVAADQVGRFMVPFGGAGI